jgi:hypothetical protein
MTPQMCATAKQIYGYVVPGRYWMDSDGTWGPVGSPYAQGNIYADAQRPRSDGGSGGGGHWGDSPGCTRSEYFGSVC